MEKKFYRVRSTKDITISVSLIVAGAILMFIPSAVGANIGGFFLLLLGILFLYLFKSVYKEEGGKDIYRMKELLFRREQLDEIQKALDSNPNKINLKGQGQGWTIKLTIYYSTSADKAYMQLFEYIPYKYEPYTQMLEYKIDQIEKLIK